MTARTVAMEKLDDGVETVRDSAVWVTSLC